jgi:hypothetical protein
MRLPTQVVSDLALVRDLNPEALGRLIEQISSPQTKPDSLTELSAIAGRVLGDQPSIGSKLIEVLNYLANHRRRLQFKVDEILDAVQTALRAGAEWSEEEFQRWENVRPAIAELLANPRFSYLVKALELRYDYANLLESSRIITDLRPVYNDEASEIDGVVVSFTMRLGFIDIDGRHGMSVALDESDVRALQRECERAVRKAQTARRRMGEAQIPTSTSGEKSDGDG